MPAKLVVTANTDGSRISLVGASGKELLGSVVFTEPRAKGATLRALKGLFGEKVAVEDATLSTSPTRAGNQPRSNGTPAAVARPARGARAVTTRTSRRKAVATVTDITAPRKATRSAKASKARARG